MEELLEVLKGIKPEIDFENEENLIEDELLDSFDIISIVAAIDDEFDVKKLQQKILFQKILTQLKLCMS